MMQTFIHSGFLCELNIVRDFIKKIDETFQDLTKSTIKNFKDTCGKNEASDEINFDRNVYITEIKEMAQKKKDAKNYQLEVQGTFYNFKIMESFLEGAPQSVLQFVIILQSEDLSDVNFLEFRWINIFISFITFSKTATEIFLQHPTKVCMNLFAKM